MYRSAMMILVILAGAGACGGGARPDVAPTPVATDDSAERARREADERARREADERARREAEEAARRRAADEAARRQQILGEMVFFDYDKWEVRAEFRNLLEQKAAILRDNPSVRLRIEGHADERGSDEYNVALGNRRATAVRQHLMRLGIDASRFDVRSWGEERPLDNRRTEAGWSRNRRSEFIVMGSMAARD